MRNVTKLFSHFLVRDTMLSQHDKKTLYKIMRKYEGNIPYMYRDKKGYVTVGIGHLLSSVSDAQKLPFYTAKNVKATAAEIKTDFDNVHKRPKGLLAQLYKPYTKLHMEQGDIDNLTYAHINSFYKELKQIYVDFDSYPKEARYALFDMIFNLGKNKLQNGFPTLNRAVRAHAWPIAAKECHRAPPVQKSRNDFVEDLFNKAAISAAGSPSQDALILSNLF